MVELTQISFGHEVEAWHAALFRQGRERLQDLEAAVREENMSQELVAIHLRAYATAAAQYGRGGGDSFSDDWWVRLLCTAAQFAARWQYVRTKGFVPRPSRSIGLAPVLYTLRRSGRLDWLQPKGAPAERRVHM